MADLVFNVAKGRMAHYASLPGANDALIAVPLESAGLVGDGDMRDYDTLADVLGGASNEQVTIGRQTLADVTVTVDDDNDRVVVDCADITWTSASGNDTGALVICYDPDTTTGSDADLIPLVKLDMAATLGGGDLVYQVNAGGFYRAS